MRKYSSKTTSAARIAYGTELSAGLKGFAETAPLAAELDPVTALLDEAFRERVARGAPVAQTRADLRVCEFLAEREIRSFARALEAAEGGRRGPAFFAVLPDGITSAIAPRRAVQARELRLVIERLGACALRAARQVAPEWLPRLTEAAARLETAVTAHGQAQTACDEAFRVELRRRDEHARIVDELVGRVRAAFPQDRAQQDAVFPSLNGRSGAGEDEVVEPAVPVQPPSPAAPVS